MNQTPLTFLGATDFLDIGHESVRAFTAAAIGDACADRDKAKRLFTAVRDQVRYDPYPRSSPGRCGLAASAHGMPADRQAALFLRGL